MKQHNIDDRIEYSDGYFVRVTGIHEYWYGVVYDVIGDDGMQILAWRGW